MLEYALNKLFFALHNDAELAASFRADRAPVIAQFGLADDTRRAVMKDDIPALAKLSNGFLMRYYFIAAGMPDPDFIAGLSRIGTEDQSA